MYTNLHTACIRREYEYCARINRVAGISAHVIPVQPPPYDDVSPPPYSLPGQTASDTLKQTDGQTHPNEPPPKYSLVANFTYS